MSKPTIKAVSLNLALYGRVPSMRVSLVTSN
ncbi:hypothetical protein SAMN05421548_118128 [Paraburkholderia lycopersici]|uniref:Uncharacterized protein n=1 Tax=Paraburkholderia lycopersici TaxID=416944 RepID=A0A1G6UAC0_9BURK|nr:hypothetical protein SAMN05421548_118128 [Paraburkholderia lycopersici]